MKTPDFVDAEKCLSIRKRSKCGEGISPEEQEFCVKMFTKYPEWYVSLSKQIFEETKPFGSVR